MLLVCHNDHVVVLIFYRGRVTRNYYDAIAMESKTGHSTHTSIFYTFLHTTKPHHVVCRKNVLLQCGASK